MSTPYGDDGGLTAYATARGVTLEGTPAVLLVKAHDYIESRSYKGARTDDAQVHSWPRTDVVVDGVALASDAVPQRVIDAEYATAIAIDGGCDPLAIESRKVKKEKVDVIEIEYDENSAGTATLHAVDALLRPLMRGGAASFEVYR